MSGSTSDRATERRPSAARRQAPRPANAAQARRGRTSCKNAGNIASLPDAGATVLRIPALPEPPTYAGLFPAPAADASDPALAPAAAMLRWAEQLGLPEPPTYAGLFPAPAADASDPAPAPALLCWDAPYLRAAAEPPALNDYFQEAKDRRAYTLANLLQCEELPPKVLQTGASEPLECPVRARLEARMARLETSMIKLEKKVRTMAATAPKRKAKRSRPSAKKTRIGRRAEQDQAPAHSSGSPCWQFMQNSGGVFPAHDFSVRNSHGWNGVAHAACANISTSSCVPARAETKSKFAIDTAGRTPTNAVRKALAWMSERVAAASLHEVVRWIIGSHGQGQ